MLMNNQTQSTQPWPLYLASEGERVQVIDLKGDQVLLRTLSAMGINHGTILEILQYREKNGIVVRCGYSRWAIDWVMAQHIWVVRLQNSF